MRRTLAALLLLAACGDDNGSTPIDAAVDAKPIDAAIDAPPAPAGHTHYVIDSILVPTNNNTARDFGQDLDGNATIDNQLGMVLGTFASMGFPVQPAATQAVDRGTAITLVDVFANSFTTEPAATFAAFVGSNPMPPACTSTSDPTCRHHLTGTGSFSIATGSPTNPALTGAITGGTLTAGPGTLVVPLAVTGGVAPVLVTLIGARVTAMQLSTAKIMTMKIGGAITSAEMDAKVYPAIHDGIAVAVARDCNALTNPPNCGCTNNTEGKNWLQLADSAPKDCAVSIEEIKTNALFQSLFAPDVMIGGQMALSVGIRATAVAGTFATP